MKLPNTRTNLLVQDLNDEVLIYDLNADKSYCLNSTAKTVFNACNGKTTIEDLKIQTKLSEDLIFLALDEIKKNELIEGEYASPFAGMNRREVIRKVGLASMIALPVISGLIAPSAANAASGNCVANAACYTAGQDICAGCTGRTISYKAYTGGVGCAGGGFDASTTCTGAFPNTTGFPVGITSVT
jgi:hypothetical protein